MKNIPADYGEMARRLKPFALFEGHSDEDVVRHLEMLDARVAEYGKGEVILREGAPANRVGLILSGAVHVCLEMPDGERCIVRIIEAGYLAGGIVLFVPQEKHLCTLVASAPCEMLTISVPRAVAWRKSAESASFFSFVERQFLMLAMESVRKGYIMSQPTVEKRIMMYLTLRCRDEGTRTVTVEGNEADFANYIGAHAVTVSRALNRLRAAGKIDYKRNVLTLKGSSPSDDFRNGFPRYPHG